MSSRTTERAERAHRTDVLVLRLSAATSASQRREAEDDLTENNLPVAHAIAARYRDRGIALDDLEQVACLALVKAVRRFDPDAGHDFLSYCVPTVRGEVRRYFRDHGWTVRPPRRIQDLQRAAQAAETTLNAAGHAATLDRVARHLGVPATDVREALALRGAFTPASLDRPAGDGSSATLGDLLSDDDTGHRGTEARVALGAVLARLGTRDRHILDRRFVQGWTQQEIADDIGVSQMQVSRLLARIYADLRTLLGDPDPAAMLA